MKWDSARVIQLRPSDPLRMGLELLGGPCAVFVGAGTCRLQPRHATGQGFLPEIAACSLNVLITGETGTGKSLLARVIHSLSPAGGQPFVGLNCPSIPATLFESELFGHEKGAFTGADGAVPGYLRLAGEGTILLDEVSEIPVELQAKLLRVIEDKEFVPVGGSKVLPVRARIIATTSTNVKKAMKEGRLRPDLFYRLSELSIHMPPLRERTRRYPLARRTLFGRVLFPIRKAVPRAERRGIAPVVRLPLAWQCARTGRADEAHGSARALPIAGGGCAPRRRTDRTRGRRRACSRRRPEVHQGGHLRGGRTRRDCGRAQSLWLQQDPRRERIEGLLPHAPAQDRQIQDRDVTPA